MATTVDFSDNDTPNDVKFFNCFGKSALLWLEQSKLLHRAATSLLEKKDSEDNAVRVLKTPIAVMLGGYAIETILKMVIIADHCDQKGFSENDRKAKDFLPTTHDLVALLKSAKLRTNKKDRILLKEISQYTLWAGRYPIPLIAAGYDGPAIFDIPNLGSGLADRPVWLGYMSLYPKLYRLAVRRTFYGKCR